VTCEATVPVLSEKVMALCARAETRIIDADAKQQSEYQRMLGKMRSTFWGRLLSAGATEFNYASACARDRRLVQIKKLRAAAGLGPTVNLSADAAAWLSSWAAEPKEKP
jgi:hypothetical protein